MAEVKDINLKRFLGYKFFKMNSEDNYTLIRIIDINEKDPTRCTIYDEETGKTSRVDYEYLKSYIPLDPYGVVTFNIIKLNNGQDDKKSVKDIMVTAHKLIDLKLGINNDAPFIICRQSVNDFFYQLIDHNPDKSEMVGISVTRDTCPTNIEMITLTACSEILDATTIHVYKDDNIESMIRCINKALKYNIDKVLKNLHDEHCDAIHATPITKHGKYINGWCSDLETLLNTNDFMVDFNQMCEVVGFDTDLTNWLDLTSNEYIYSLNTPARLFFATVFKANVIDTKVIKFDYSINMGDFQNENYAMIRDKNNVLWIVVYLTQGQYLERDLMDQINKLDVTDRLQLAYFNKYANL